MATGIPSSDEADQHTETSGQATWKRSMTLHRNQSESQRIAAQQGELAQSKRSTVLLLCSHSSLVLSVVIHKFDFRPCKGADGRYKHGTVTPPFAST